MGEHRKREKVVAEISLAHLTQVAQDIGRMLSPEGAVAFLNEEGRAYEMWKRMMAAGEEYIKQALRAHSRLVVSHAPNRSRPAV